MTPIKEAGQTTAIAIIAFLLGTITTPEAWEPQTADFHEVEAITLAPETGTLIDARPRSDYQAGHIQGAINLPMDEPIPAHIAQTPKPRIIYCQGATCTDSHTLAKKLHGKGIETKIYTGGWEEWNFVMSP
jgi:rhodanese-related sulfurtransferase